MTLNNTTQEMVIEKNTKSEKIDVSNLESSVYEVDVLSQFRANMVQLEDLQGRFKFVLHEVSSLLVKK